MPPEENNHSETVGILYCGDMGSAFGRLCRKAGLRVVTTCEGRSRITVEQAESSGFEILPGIADVVAQSNFVFSLVLPDAAFTVARQYADLGETRPPDSIFVDANSIDLEQVGRIERMMADESIPFADAAIHGTARRLEELNLLFVSGPPAREVAEAFRGVMRVTCLGDQIGSASRMKLVISALSKTLVAMFLEIGTLAEKSDMLEPFLETCGLFYPGVMSAVERMLPTYPRHASRRADQLRDIEHFANTCDFSPGIIHAAGDLIELVANIDWNNTDPETLDIQSIIRTMSEHCSTTDETHTEITQ